MNFLHAAKIVAKAKSTTDTSLKINDLNAAEPIETFVHCIREKYNNIRSVQYNEANIASKKSIAAVKIGGIDLYPMKEFIIYMKYPGASIIDPSDSFYNIIFKIHYITTDGIPCCSLDIKDLSTITDNHSYLRIVSTLISLACNSLTVMISFIVNGDFVNERVLVYKNKQLDLNDTILHLSRYKEATTMDFVHIKNYYISMPCIDPFITGEIMNAIKTLTDAQNIGKTINEIIRRLLLLAASEKPLSKEYVRVIIICVSGIQSKMMDKMLTLVVNNTPITKVEPDPEPDTSAGANRDAKKRKIA
jgi:hypothetical protein